MDNQRLLPALVCRLFIASKQDQNRKPSPAEAVGLELGAGADKGSGKSGTGTASTRGSGTGVGLGTGPCANPEVAVRNRTVGHKPWMVDDSCLGITSEWPVILAQSPKYPADHIYG